MSTHARRGAWCVMTPWLARGMAAGLVMLAPGGVTAGSPVDHKAAPWVAQASSPLPHRSVYQRDAREGIQVLSPTQAMPVEAVADLPYQELAPAPLSLDPLPCDLYPSEGLTDASLQIDTNDAPNERPVALPVQCANVFPDVPSALAPARTYDFGLDASELGLTEPVMVVTRSHPSTHAWFSSVGSQYGFAYRGGGWTYRDTVGPTVSLGNLTANAPLWGSTVPLGGLQFSSGWRTGSEVLSPGAVAVSSSIGRLNYTDTSATAGAIDYGATAGSGSLRYGLTPTLTLESQIQTAPDMETRGVGTTYAAGELGTFRLGVTRSEFEQAHAWRYRLGYNVNLSESVSVAVTNEQIEAGFGDLSVYRDGVAASPIMRNTLAAGVPLRGGTLTGTYTGTRESGIAVEQRFGLEHSRFVAPGVRLAVGADRDILTGDYEMRAGISMPVDTFMHGRWLPW